MFTAMEKAQALLEGFKGEEGARGNPFSEMLELNLLASIEDLLKQQEAETRLEMANECIAKIESCNRDMSGECIWLLDAVKALTGLSETAKEKVTQDIDSKMKAAGMTPLSVMLGKSPMDSFIQHSGVSDLNRFEQWLSMRVEETARGLARMNLADKDETNDEMYEWWLAHAAVFKEVKVNFDAALEQTK